MAARPILAAGAHVLAPIGLAFALTGSAQTADPVARVFHPAAPLPSYDVATIKPDDPAGTTTPNGMRFFRGSTIRNYIRGAYAPSAGLLPPTQVIGGPEWLDKDRYIINSKPPADLELAMRQMKTDDRLRQDHAMQQSLLADRFHLKVHFEVREMPVYALVPAKGGLKIKAVADPVPPAPDSSPSQPPSAQKPPNPGMLGITMKGADRAIIAHAISMAQLTGILGSLINQTSPTSISLADTGDRPVIDQTGFTGYFDIDDMKWAVLTTTDSPSPSDAPSLETALGETLGIKLVATKGPVEVVVIDSIDRPSEN